MSNTMYDLDQCSKEQLIDNLLSRGTFEDALNATKKIIEYLQKKEESKDENILVELTNAWDAIDNILFDLERKNEKEI